MRARLYRPGTTDAAALDRLLLHNSQGDVRLGTDRIVVAERGPDDLSGTLVWRPAGYIHELVLDPRVPRRMAAVALANFALGDCKQMFQPRQAVFLVDSHNAPMLRFVRDVGAVAQTGSVFTLDLD